MFSTAETSPAWFWLQGTVCIVTTRLLSGIWVMQLPTATSVAFTEPLSVTNATTTTATTNHHPEAGDHQAGDREPASALPAVLGLGQRDDAADDAEQNGADDAQNQRGDRPAARRARRLWVRLAVRVSRRRVRGSAVVGRWVLRLLVLRRLVLAADRRKARSLMKNSWSAAQRSGSRGIGRGDADDPSVAVLPGFRRRVERVAAEGGSDRCCRGVLRELGIAVVSEALHRGVTGVVGCVRNGQRGVHLAFVREVAGHPLHTGRQKPSRRILDAVAHPQVARVYRFAVTAQRERDDRGDEQHPHR